MTVLTNSCDSGHCSARGKLSSPFVITYPATAVVAVYRDFGARGLAIPSRIRCHDWFRQYWLRLFERIKRVSAVWQSAKAAPSVSSKMMSRN